MSIQKRLARVLISRGLNAKGAAGIIGNAYQESGLNPASVGDGGGGLWGFTAGAISLGSLQSYAHAKGESWTSPETQANFLMDHVSAGDKKALNAQPTARAAAAWFMNNWERPLVATENAARRMDGAEQTFKMIKGLGTNAKVARGRATGRTTQRGGPSSVTQTTAAPTRASVLSGLLAPTPISTSVSSPVSLSIPTLTLPKIK